MTYLPNSIERCTPIVGFDPYAFVMDKPSNLRINKMQSPYGMDYYAVGPENKKDEAENTDGTKKKGTLGKVLKTGVGIAAIALGIFGLARCRGRATAGGVSSTGGIGAFFKNIGTIAACTFSRGLSFAAAQITRFANFVQSKIVSTPPAP